MKIILTHIFINHIEGSSLEFNKEYKDVKSFAAEIYQLFPKQSLEYGKAKNLRQGYGDIIDDMKLLKEAISKLTGRNETHSFSYSIKIVGE